MCDQTFLRELRSAEDADLVVRALDTTVPTSDALPPFVYAEWQPPGSRPPIAGQVVLVEQVVGGNADATRHALGARWLAVLVPWDHDESCAPIPWTRGPRWMKPDTHGFVAARLRPRDKWAGDYPTFDVRDAWREPYTELRGRQYAGPAGEATSIMTPSEYGSFYATLPTLDAWVRDPRAAIRAMIEWERANPTLAAKQPAHVLLMTRRRAAEEEAKRR